MWSYENDKVSTAIGLFKKANQADPEFAPAYAYLAYSYYITVIMGFADEPESNLQKGLAAANLALKHDDKDAIPYFAAGRIYMMLGNHDASIASLEKSIELNPSFAQSYHGLGFALALAGRLEEAKQTTQKAVDLSPRDPMRWAFTVVHALACVLDGDNEKGLTWALQTLQTPTATGYWPHAVMAASLANLNRTDEARIALADAVNAKPDLTIAFLKENMPTKDENGLEPYLAGLRKAGLAES
jgi:adenylate cyclase